jgi:amino acid adenylation domain-containing protein
MKINLLNYFDEGALSNSPRSIAVKDLNRDITFKDLEHYSKNLSFQIKKYLQSTRQPIAVFMPKCAEVIISNLAILYSGNFYTNFDFLSPIERLKVLIQSISPRLIISNQEGIKKLKELDIFDENLIINVEDSLSGKILYDYDSISKNVLKQIDTDPACVISTSGSTGTPKSVVLSHRNIIDFIDWCSETFVFENLDVIGSLSPFHFDIYILELYISLSKGCTIHLIPQKESAFPADLVNFLASNKVTFIFWVPTIMVNISNLNILDSIKLSSLKKIFFAGEVFPTKHLNYWRNKVPDALFVNLYGPIEIAVDCTYFIVNRIFKDNESVPIGQPCKNTDILILNSNNQIAEDGEQGELCVRGSSLALGYFNNQEQTDKVFVQNPLNSSYPERIYRTGDLVYTNEHGEIIFIGRKDFQIKHMGYRIELSEIEIAAQALRDIKNACILYNSVSKQIIMIYESDNHLTDIDIRLKLSQNLPKYMLPTKIRRVELIPRNSNGKIDRQKLLSEFA